MSRWYEEEDNGRLAWNDITECARVPAPNPWKDGIRVSAQPDMYPKGFTPDELNAVYWELSRGDGLDKLMEAASFEEFDSYYNPGTEYVEAAFITEALVIKKFARTEEVMRRGLVKALRRFLDAKDPTTGAPIELLDPIVGKPRKSGMYAYVTVQLPFSDGQVVSILFHAPEGDGKRITPQDTIVAFRWMLNKRDITNIVAPEEGKEVSVATIGRRLSLLVEKNTARFASTQKEAQEEQRELARINDRLKELEEEIQKVSDAIVQANLDLETEAAENGNTKALVERQKVTNAELRAKLEALQKAQVERDKTEADREPGETEVETETGENGVGDGEETGASETGDQPTATEPEGDLHEGVSETVMQLLQNAKTCFYTHEALADAGDSGSNWTPGKNALLWGPTLGQIGWSFTLVDLRSDDADLTLQFKLGREGGHVAIPAMSDEEFVKLCLLNARKRNEKTFRRIVRGAVATGNLMRALVYNFSPQDKRERHAGYFDALEIWQEAQRLTLDEILQMGAAPETEVPETETPTDTTGDTATDTTATEPSTEEPATENPVPDDPTITADTVETEEPAATEEPTATEEPAPAVEPEPTTEEPETVETEEPAADTPEFVKDLNDVLAGKYDDNLTRVTEIMRTAVTQMATPGMEQYQELANNASRYFSKLLAGAFAKKVA